MRFVRTRVLLPGLAVAATGVGTHQVLSGSTSTPNANRTPRVSTQAHPIIAPAPPVKPREKPVRTKVRFRRTEHRLRPERGRPADADANQQVGSLERFIAKRTADHEVTVKEAGEILDHADEHGVQVGELALERRLAGRQALVREAREGFREAVDSIVPEGAPTARMAAILFRLDPSAGREQLLDLLERSQSRVEGGPKTFVIHDGVEPYIAAITTGQVISGLVKFMDGASPSDARRIRRLLDEQLNVLQQPVSRGGLRVPGLTGDRGLALAAQTAQGEEIAINQSAFVLKALERVVKLEGAKNGRLARRARRVANRVAIELKADLEAAYPAKGSLAYGLQIRAGRAATTQLEDGDHLLTTILSLRGLDLFKKRFAPIVRRMEARYPELKFAGPEDFDGRPGHIFTDDFNEFREAAKHGSAERLERLARRDGLRSTGENALLAMRKR